MKILAMGTVGVGLISCSDKTEYIIERESASMERNINAEVSDFKNWAEERSEDIEDRMEVLERDMDKAGAEAKKEMKAAWNDLKALNEKIEAKISKMRSEARPEWREFRSAIDSEWMELKRDSRNFFYGE